MLRLFGRRPDSRDGGTRRELLRVGALSLFGSMTTPRLLRAADSGGATRPGKARSVILFNLLGGPSHMDMFDLKPDAPAEVRGEFRPIATSVPGLQICEHLPRTARLDAQGEPDPFGHARLQHPQPAAVLTGFTGGDPEQLRPERTDPPDIGAVCQYLGHGAGGHALARSACPAIPGWGASQTGIRRAGPYGGFLGSQYDPLFAACDPNFDREFEQAKEFYDPVSPIGEPPLPSLDDVPEMTVERLDRRRSLLEQLDDAFERANASAGVATMDQFQQRAFALLTSSRGPRRVRPRRASPTRSADRYGRNLFGTSLLVARRLVEAGVPFVSVHAENFGTHGTLGHAREQLRHAQGLQPAQPRPGRSPRCSRTSTARGLLDSTLVVVMGEMGRTPRVNAKAGRDHWPQCGFCLLAGGGVKPGVVHGASDKQAAYPTSDPVSPGDLVATIYHLLGIDPDLTVPDRTGRPIADRPRRRTDPGRDPLSRGRGEVPHFWAAR